MEVGGMLPSHRQEEISPIKEGDYVGEDGLIRCGVCGKRKQFKIEISGFKKIVPCICKCRSDEIEKEKQKDEYEQRMHAINRLKDASMMYDCIKDLEDDIAEILEDDSDKDNFFYGIIKNHEIMMFDEFGRGNNVEIISAGDLTAMLASVRMLSCEFIENGK